jgi:hypothetical protein
MFVGALQYFPRCRLFGKLHASWMQPRYSFPEYLHHLLLLCLYNRFSFMLRNSCIWMQCCLWEVRRKGDVETDYIGIRANTDDVTRYHAVGKQPVSASRTFCCAFFEKTFRLSQGRLLRVGVLPVSNTVQRVSSFLREIRFMSWQRVCSCLHESGLKCLL